MKLARIFFGVVMAMIGMLAARAAKADETAPATASAATTTPADSNTVRVPGTDLVDPIATSIKTETAKRAVLKAIANNYKSYRETIQAQIEDLKKQRKQLRSQLRSFVVKLDTADSKYFDAITIRIQDLKWEDVLLANDIEQFEAEIVKLRQAALSARLSETHETLSASDGLQVK